MDIWASNGLKLMTKPQKNRRCWNQKTQKSVSTNQKMQKTEDVGIHRIDILASSRHFHGPGLKDLVFGAYFDQPLEDVDFPEGLDTRPVCARNKVTDLCETQRGNLRNDCLGWCSACVCHFMEDLICFNVSKWYSWYEGIADRGSSKIKASMKDFQWNRPGSISWSSMVG